jgi:hypothetical protein
MQRIDENTYIDDTLVTCAEYQLFIDEMREQGKYYQPDHWIAYQFPNGEARKPIIGVRHSDAEAFCEWLTRRGDGEWKFRLPTQKDVDTFPVKSSERSPLGYWIGADYQFAWAGNILENPRALDHTLSLDFDRTRTDALDRARVRALDLDLNRDRERAHNLDHNLAIARNLAIDPTRDPTLDPDRDQTPARDLARVLDLDLAHALNSDLAFSGALVSYLAFPRTRDFDLTYALGFARALARDYALNLASERTYNLDLANALSSAQDFALDIYIDLFTLRERIAGRSPAFEGIRLVKERTR